jgi:Prokaryotic RING finger family 1
MAQLRFEGGEGGREISLPVGEGPVFLVAAGKVEGIHIVTERPKTFLAALLHTGGHWLVLAPPGGRDLAVDGVEVPWLKILDDQSVLAIGGLALRLTETTEETLGADAALIRQGKACPVCLTLFAPGDSVIYCPTCGLAHHAECLRRAKRCAGSPFDGYILPGEDGQEQAITRP